MCYIWVLSGSEKNTFPRALVAGARLREAKKNMMLLFSGSGCFFVQILTNCCETFFSRPKGEPFFFLGDDVFGVECPRRGQ